MSKVNNKNDELSIKIYTMTHKKFDLPTDPIYIPLHVGREGKEDLGYLCDNTGDNISNLNCYYSELTGLYWAWKNDTTSDILGLCHYRRYLLDENELVLTKDEIVDYLKDYDILTSKKLELNFSYYYGFGKNHDEGDLNILASVLKDMYPSFYSMYEKRVHEKNTYFGNIMICKRDLFAAYCQFLFPIFEKMHPLLDLDKLDSYHKRLYGFISEFLLMVWCEYNGLKVKECKVGIIGEKKETHEVVERILLYFAEGDYLNAKSYFLDINRKRPDIMMEASDVDGRLHLCLEAISICEFEMAEYGKIIFPIKDNPETIFSLLNQINEYASSESESTLLLKNEKISDVACFIAKKLYSSNG